MIRLSSCIFQRIKYSQFNHVKNIHASGNSRQRVMATDGVDEACIEIFKSRGHEVDFVKTMPESELIKVIGKYDGLVVRSATKVTANVLAAGGSQSGGKLRIVGRAGVGVDNIDVNEATKQGVMVMNTPGGNTVSTAQLAVSLICSLARKIPAADMSIKADKWDRKSFMGNEINGKILGIIGCGRIGQVVASCAIGLGMKVYGYDPVMSAESLKEFNILPASLDDIWAKSDFITLHTPLTSQTKGIINDETIAKCKKGVSIVNCARGGIVDEDALLRGLESGHIAGAALDVYTSEPPKENLHPLLKHPNLICTPHLGASTDEAQINVSRDIAVQMCDLFDGRDFIGVMNVSYAAASSQPHMKPFMNLAETIGAVIAQLKPQEDNHICPIKSIELKTWGGRDVNITTKQARLLLQAMVLKGVLSKTKINGITLTPDMISAPILANELNLKSIISDEQPQGIRSTPYWNVVSVKATRLDDSVTEITGSVFGTLPHLTQVDDFKDSFAFQPSESKHLLTFRNEDRPGAISQVLSVLSKEHINVASLNVARANVLQNSTSKYALCFMALDQRISQDTLATIRSFSALQDVALINL